MSLRRRITVRQVLVTVVVLALVFPFAAYAVPALVGTDESYVVLTGSMRPAIAPGDVVFVAATPASAVAVGDVITFDRGASVPTTHRVIEVIEEDGTYLFRTQGDANEDPDAGLVTEGRLIGVVTLSVPFLGSLVTAVDSQYGFVALVVLPFALLVVDIAYGAVRSRRNDGDSGGSDDGDALDDGAGGAIGPGATVAGAAADGPQLPAVYDPVRAAEAYYAAAADARVDAATAASAAEPAPGGALTGRDMTASIALAALLVAYAAWNAYWQITALDAPRPETMSVLSGALVGLAFLVYLRFTGERDGGDGPNGPGDTDVDGDDRVTVPGFPPVRIAGAPAAAPAAREEEVYNAD